MLIDINLEALAIALKFPIRNFVAQAVEIRIAAEIEIADEHAAEVADVADVAFADAERSEKSNAGHNGDDPLHFYRHRNWKKISASVREQNGAGDHDAEDCAGRADG